LPATIQKGAVGIYVSSFWFKFYRNRVEYQAEPSRTNANMADEPNENTNLVPVERNQGKPAKGKYFKEGLQHWQYERACKDLGISDSAKGTTGLAILGRKDFEIGGFNINAGCLSFERNHLLRDIATLDETLKTATDAKSIIAIVKAKATLYVQLTHNAKAMTVIAAAKREEEKPEKDQQATWRPGQMVSPVQINVSGSNGGGKVEIKALEQPKEDEIP
jgi:hypothetical protein